MAGAPTGQTARIPGHGAGQGVCTPTRATFPRLPSDRESAGLWASAAQHPGATDAPGAGPAQSGFSQFTPPASRRLHLGGAPGGEATGSGPSCRERGTTMPGAGATGRGGLPQTSSRRGLLSSQGRRPKRRPDRGRTEPSAAQPVRAHTGPWAPRAEAHTSTPPPSHLVISSVRPECLGRCHTVLGLGVPRPRPARGCRDSPTPPPTLALYPHRELPPAPWRVSLPWRVCRTLQSVLLAWPQLARSPHKGCRRPPGWTAKATDASVSSEVTLPVWASEVTASGPCCPAPSLQGPAPPPPPHSPEHVSTSGQEARHRGSVPREEGLDGVAPIGSCSCEQVSRAELSGLGLGCS